MTQNRVFFPQEALDTWLEGGRVSLVGDELTANPEGRCFQLESAIRFMSEVAAGEDPLELVGKVKRLDQLEAIGGEHSTGSVIVGDCAYEVIDGFLGELLPSTNRVSPRKTGPSSKVAPDDALSQVLRRDQGP